MAIGWLTVLKNVPWSDVLSTAPKVADSARKLWNAVARNPAPPEAPVAATQSAASPDADAIAALQSRLAAMKVATDELHAQMLASSELINALADQNAQLVARIEAYRGRVFWLTLGTAAAGAVAVLALILVLIRGGA